MQKAHALTWAKPTIHAPGGERTANIKSTRKQPGKPYPEFTLFAYNSGSWCRKIRGKLHSFGGWDDLTAAMEKHNKEYPYRKSGVPVPDKFDGLTVADLCNKLLAAKDDDRASGEITERWFNDLKKVGELIVANIDRNGPDDLRELRQAIIKKHSPTISRNTMLRAKSFFRFAWENRLIDKPVRYGDAFKALRRALERKHRADKGPKVFTPTQVKKIVDKCIRPMKAACLLMLNCRLLNSDICKLPLKAIDEERGWLNYPGLKTGIGRRARLWSETIEVVRDYLNHRPSDALPELVFMTRFGQ